MRISETLRHVIKTHGFVGRWGGEEFIMVIESDQDEMVLQLAKQMQEAVEEIKHDMIDQALHITITQGICKYDSQYTVDQCIAFADKALYKGKSDGRNCIVVYG